MFNKIRDFYQFYKEIGNNRKDWSSQWLKLKEQNILNAHGRTITEPARQSYLVQKCVNIISQNAPQAPLEFFMVGENTDALKLPMSAPINQLFNNPNELMSRYDFIASTSAYMTLYGEAFWYLVPSVGQVAGTSVLPAEIWVLDPRKMKEVVDEKTGALLGWLFNSKVSLTKQEVIIFKNVNPYNPYRGLSPLDAVDIEISADYKAGEYQQRFFENGSVPSMVLETGPDDNSTVAELKKIKKMWEQQHRGSKNAKKIGVLRGGMTLKPIGLTQMEMDFINSRQMTRDIILSIFGVPKTIAGFTEEVNRATAEVQKRLFWSETVKPQLIRIQTTLTNKFIYRLNLNMVARFDFLQIDELQRNFEDEVNVASKLFMMGFARNELNDRFALGFEEDTDFGDDKYVPLNLLNVDDDPRVSDGSEIQATNQLLIEPEIQKGDQRQDKLNELLGRNIKRYEKMMTGRLKKFFFSQRVSLLKYLDNEIDMDKFDIQDGKLAKLLISVFNEASKTAGQMVLFVLGSEDDCKIDPEVVFKYVNRTKVLNQKVLKNVKLQIQEGTDNEESIDDIKKRIKKLYRRIIRLFR